MKLKDEIAIVTGASRGIGRGIALALAAEGATVVVNYQSNEKAAFEVIAEIEQQGGRAWACPANVADATQVQTMVEHTLERFGKLDILVNNAGISRDGLVVQMPSGLWREVMDVNFGGTFNCTQAALGPMMKERKGAIVNISSAMGDRAWHGQSNYAASKAAINAFTRCVALETARFGIRVNAVSPGFIPTEMVSALLEKHEQGILKQIPMRTFASVEDVAKAVIFMASPDSGYVTGEVLHLDGGVTMTMAMGTPNPR